MFLIHHLHQSTHTTSVLCKYRIYVTMVTGVLCLNSFGKVEHLPIYKKRKCYGFLNVEKYVSVEDFVADLSRTGFTMFEGTILVTLTKQLFPDK